MSGFLVIVGVALISGSSLVTDSEITEASKIAILRSITDEQFCEMQRKEAANVNREAPIQVDFVTRLTGIVVVCALRQVTFNKSVSLDPNSLRPNWREAYQRGHDQTTCENRLFATMTRRGWRMSQAVSFPDGKRAIFTTIACPKR